LAEREQVASERAHGRSWSAIARQLGRAPSTITREVRRNALPKGGYQPVHAEGCSRERRQRPAILEIEAKLRRFVHQRLVEGWTPEQIRAAAGSSAARSGACGRCAWRPFTPSSTAPPRRPRSWGAGCPSAAPSAAAARRASRKAREPRRTIPERRSIHDRPSEVEARGKAGPWEGDLIICQRTRPVLVLIERKTRFVLAARLAGKSARRPRPARS
jgi:IS30 family transposase